MTTHRLQADPAAAGARLDVWLAEAMEITRSAAVRLIEDGCVRVAGKPAPKKLKLSGGEEIEVDVPDPVPAEAQPQNIPLDIVYEDDDIIVVNKPSGMVVHPAAGNPDGTLVNALLWHCGDSLSGIGGVIRPGIVHRIDKDTSGLLVVAKHDEAHLTLAAGLKEHAIARVYEAIAVGNLREDAGTVDAPIGRHPTDRKRMAVLHGSPNAREAVTHWQVLARFDGFTHVRCQLETGRTHQIRVHMASLGHPLLGDPVYGGDKVRFCRLHPDLIQGQCLHAGELRFVHPRTGEEMRFTAPCPAEFSALLTKLRRMSGMAEEDENGTL
ncbi:MAG: RluA family pseudouridine synthase [Clostridia bacterium]|nr:RluA family pseudouridine synthase [Clostridia bacterium]